MKKVLSVLLTFVISLSLVCSVGASSPETEDRVIGRSLGSSGLVMGQSGLEGTFYDFFSDPVFAEVVATTLGQSGTSCTNERELKRVTHLYYFGYNAPKIQSIKGIEFLSSILVLELGSNNISEIPLEIENLSKLTFLDLRRNKITEIPAEIKGLTNLQFLDLSANQLESCPNEIGNLKNLTDLDLSANQLSTIPESIRNLSKLIYLSLNVNNLNKLPKTISELSKLEMLRLEDNNFSNIPSELMLMKNIKY